MYPRVKKNTGDTEVTNASRQQKLREERRKKDLVRVEFWVHKLDKPALIEKAVVLNRKRRDD